VGETEIRKGFWKRNVPGGKGVHNETDEDEREKKKRGI